MADEQPSTSAGSEPAAQRIGAPAPRPRQGAAWAEPILAADRAWTRFEKWLAFVALSLEVLSMSLWTGLKGFSAAPDQLGSVFRSIVGAVVFGTVAHVVLARRNPNLRVGVTLGAIVVGFLSARAWANVGVDYASNLLNWYQQACFLTLLGGLRGVGTRLTMLLAFVGGSLATAGGRHIVIDVVTRFVNQRTRVAMVLAGWAAAAVVCVVAAWGFFDYIAIENFGANADDRAAAKAGQVVHQLGEDFFIARKQIELDFKATPHVLFRGEVYSDWLTGSEWNAWIDSAGFPEHYGKEAAEALKIPVDGTRSPLVVIPGRGEPRGELINAAYLVVPFGLLVIAMRFIVRALLVLSGHVSTESEESEEWSDQASADEGHAEASAQ
jgi:TRAP-type C4-dicarboxylate transport system permease small subunit